MMDLHLGIGVSDLLPTPLGAKILSDSTIAEDTGQQHANHGKSATNHTTKTWRQKGVCPKHKKINLQNFHRNWMSWSYDYFES
jgi:hypothetical protein